MEFGVWGYPTRWRSRVTTMCRGISPVGTCAPSPPRHVNLSLSLSLYAPVPSLPCGPRSLASLPSPLRRVNLARAGGNIQRWINTLDLKHTGREREEGRVGAPYRDGPASGENISHLCRLRILRERGRKVDLFGELLNLELLEVDVARLLGDDVVGVQPAVIPRPVRIPDDKVLSARGPYFLPS